jgi:hypothetical protein
MSQLISLRKKQSPAIIFLEAGLPFSLSTKYGGKAFLGQGLKNSISSL